MIIIIILFYDIILIESKDEFMSTFNAAKTNEKKKRSTYEKFKNSVGQEEVEEEPLLVRIHYLKCGASSGWSFGPN